MSDMSGLPPDDPNSFQQWLREIDERTRGGDPADREDTPEGCFRMMLIALTTLGLFAAGLVTWGEEAPTNLETVVVAMNEPADDDPPQTEHPEFTASEVPFDLDHPEPPVTRVLDETVIGTVSAAELVAGDEGAVSMVVLAPEERTFYSVSRHRYVTTAEGAATVVHLFGPTIDREATLLKLDVAAVVEAAPGPVAVTLAAESEGAVFLLPAISELADTAELRWEVPPEALTPLAEGGPGFDGTRPFRLGIALTVATTQPGEAQFRTLLTETTATIGFSESGPASGF